MFRYIRVVLCKDSPGVRIVLSDEGESDIELIRRINFDIDGKPYYLYGAYRTIGDIDDEGLRSMLSDVFSDHFIKCQDGLNVYDLPADKVFSLLESAATLSDTGVFLHRYNVKTMKR